MADAHPPPKRPRQAEQPKPAAPGPADAAPAVSAAATGSVSLGTWRGAGQGAEVVSLRGKVTQRFGATGRSGRSLIRQILVHGTC
eukprot:SAG31_NODE_30717_length_377_cov_0.561151_1_plen_84_part_10